MDAQRDLVAGLGVSLAQVSCFVAVAGRLSFSRAAEDLHLAQPWVSTQVRKLETRLGVELFNRSGGVELTGAGEALLPAARRVLAEVGGFAAAAAALRRQGVGGLALGGPAYAWTAPRRMRLLAEFRERFPGVSVSTVNRRAGELVTLLRAGELDLAFVPGPATDGQLGRVVVDLLRRWVVVPDAHPLAGQGPVGLAELAGHRMVVFNRAQSSALHDQLYGDLAAAGVELVTTPESNPEAMSLLALEQGMLSLAVGPPKGAARAGAMLRGIDRDPRQIELALVCAGDRPTNEYALAFWQAAQAAVTSGYSGSR